MQCVVSGTATYPTHHTHPRTQEALEQWNPRTDTVPMHAWLHPWLLVLCHHLELLYPALRYRLRICLHA